MMGNLIVDNSEKNLLHPELIDIQINVRPIFHLCMTDLDGKYSL